MPPRKKYLMTHSQKQELEDALESWGLLYDTPLLRAQAYTRIKNLLNNLEESHDEQTPLRSPTHP